MIKKLIPTGFIGGLIRRISGIGGKPAEIAAPDDDALAAPEDDPLAESAARAAYRRSHGLADPATLPGTARRAEPGASAGAPAASGASGKTARPTRGGSPGNGGNGGNGSNPGNGNGGNGSGNGASTRPANGRGDRSDRSNRADADERPDYADDNSLRGRPARPAARAPQAVGPDGNPREPKIHSARELGIDVRHIPSYATRVALTLHDAGYAAFIVGGAVRDLLSNANPKDFDVATDATPEQVHAVFRRSRIIGRRFQIVHVGYGREIVEVSTFRALQPPVEAEDPTGEVAEAEPAEQSTEAHGHEAQTGRRRERRQQPVAQTRAVDEHGRLTRDNIFGEQWEDAARRDFTINAMFYDPSNETVLDYHGGVDDIRARRLRIIGDAATRYREDPVRMLRAVRFAAKLGFELDARTGAPIAELADLVANVPQARLFDEMLKLLFCGNAGDAIRRLRAAGLHRGLLPLLDSTDSSPEAERFVGLALASTDARVKADKPTSPGFLFAALLWPDVHSVWQARMDGRRGEMMASLPALFAAADDVLASQFERFAIQRRFVADMKEIWSLQPRFERRNGRNPYRLLEQPRFRAGYDFFVLRAEAGEVPMSMADWWTAFADADSGARDGLIDQAANEDRAGGAPVSPAAKKRRKKKAAAPRVEGLEGADVGVEEDVRFTRNGNGDGSGADDEPAPDTSAMPAGSADDHADAGTASDADGDRPPDAAAPAKRRRRRSPRKPAALEGGQADGDHGTADAAHPAAPAGDEH